MRRVIFLISLLILSVSIFAEESDLIDSFVTEDETSYSAIYKPSENENFYTVLVEKKYNSKYAETLQFQVNKETAEELYSIACRNATEDNMFNILKNIANEKYKCIKSENSYDLDNYCWRTYFYNLP